MISSNQIIFTAILLIACFRQEVLPQDENVDIVSEEGKVMLSDSFTIDLSVSKVIWSGKALGIIKHEGTVDFTQASLQVSEGRVKGGTFIVDLTTITATDKNLNPMKGSKYEKLKQHLSSSEFFDVETYPTATFNLDTIIANSAFGKLTLRNHSHQEQVENILISSEGNAIAITGDLVFNRKKFDVSWDTRFKDGIMADDIKLKVMLYGN
jgi:polyisoprenoid-binding protein YceI